MFLFQVAQIVALVAASLSVGYALGARQLSATQIKAAESSTPAKAPTAEAKQTEGDDEDDEDDDEADGDLSAVRPGMFEECKLVCLSCFRLVRQHI